MSSPKSKPLASPLLRKSSTDAVRAAASPANAVNKGLRKLNVNDDAATTPVRTSATGQWERRGGSAVTDATDPHSDDHATRATQPSAQQTRNNDDMRAGDNGAFGSLCISTPSAAVGQ